MTKFKTLKLNEFVDILSGFAFKSDLFNDSEGIPIIRIRDVVRGRSQTYYRGKYDDTYVINNGDILIGMDGEFNTARWKGGPALLNQRVCQIKSHADKLNESYLLHFLPIALKQIEDVTPFVTVKHLSVKTIREIQIPLPPIATQKHIAAILDQAEELRSKRRSAIALLDELGRSVFLEMFGDPVINPKGWDRVPFGELLSAIESGKSPNCLDRPVAEGEWGVLKLGAVTWCEYNSSENKALPFKEKPDPTLEVKSGDLLFTRKNTYELVAACVLVRSTPPNLLLPDLIFRFRLKSDAVIDLCFLHQLLINPNKRREIQKLASGSSSSMPNISKSKLQITLIEVPPLALQQQFAKRMEAIETLKATHRQSLAKLDSLFASLQSAAFNGELRIENKEF